MGELKVNAEHPAIRCEVCHQNDCFEANTGTCTRCGNISQLHLEGKKQYFGHFKQHKNEIILIGLISLLSSMIGLQRYPHIYQAVFIWLFLNFTGCYLLRRYFSKVEVVNQIEGKKNRAWPYLLIANVGFSCFIGTILCLAVFYSLPQRQIPLPKLSDGNISDVRLSLERTRCYGACPAYITTVYGNGTVFCQMYGKRKMIIISEEKVRRLIAHYEDANYFNLKGSYDENNCSSSRSDHPSVITSITVGDKTTTVYDYIGQDCSPPKLRELEDSFDDLVGLKQWIDEVNRTRPSEKVDIKVLLKSLQQKQKTSY